MESHVKILGILNIVMGALGVVTALGMLLLFGGIGMATASSGDPDAAVALPILGAIGGVVFVIVLIVSVPVIIAGWGIMNYKGWARILGIILSVLQLVNVPIGTAVGIYGLWVLTQSRTAEMFRQRRAAPVF